MKNTMRKLSLGKETLQRLDVWRRSGDVVSPDFSCIESCYLVSCDGGCGISEGQKGG
jgi:hypothetical protein